MAPFRKIFRLALAVTFGASLLLTHSSATRANLIEVDLVPGSGDGLLTRDTASGFEWLDLSQTVNRSYSDVSTQLAPGGDFEGFRYATHSEVEDLIAEAGLPPSQLFTPALYDPAFAFITLVGGSINSATDAQALGIIDLPFGSSFQLKGVVAREQFGSLGGITFTTCCVTVTETDPRKSSWLLRASVVSRELLPAVDGLVIDRPRDGTTDFVDEDNLQVTQNPFTEDRGVIEFELGPIGPDQIESALLKLVPIGAGGFTPIFTLQLFGFSGDGAIKLEDFDVGSLITSFDVQALPLAGDPIFIDVTQFLQSLIQRNFAGFNLRMVTENSSLNFGSIELGPPATLTVAVVPPIRVPLDQPSIQDAIDFAVDGNTVLVAPGTYIENINFLGKAITVSSEGGPEVTIIDGFNAGSVVVFNSGEGQTSVLSGFTLQNGSASFGAGITISISSPTIIGNIFDSNFQGAGGFGAGIGGNGSSATIERNIFRDNSCDNQFLSGVVSFVNTSSPRIINNVFENNPCRAINMTLPTGNQPVVINNTIFGNRVGVRVDRRISAILQTYENNIIVQNEIGLEIDFGSEVNNPTWQNNLVFGNGIDYDVIADQTGVNGNISDDPLFGDPSNGDYRLQFDSPSIDAGDNTAPNLPVLDLDGNPRVFDGDGDGQAVVDMGAFEFGGIPEVPFAVFDVAKVTVKAASPLSKFKLHGFFELGATSDGIDPLSEPVTVCFGTFCETIPAGAFFQDSKGFQYRDGTPGIKKVVITEGGDFEVDVRSVDLAGTNFGSPVPVSFRIGNDRGETSVPARAR